MSKLIKQGFVYYQDEFRPLEIYIENDGTMVIADKIELEVDEVIDATGLHIVPGFIDPHTHLREPGFEYKETIKSGTHAAAKGGYTTIFCMPNLNPVTDTKEAYLDLEKRITQDALIHVVPYAAISKDLKGEQLTDIDELCKHTLFFSDDGKGIQKEKMMLEAMHKAQAHNAVIVAHCEDEQYLIANGAVHQGLLVNKFGTIGISSESEYKQIERDLRLVRQSQCQYHVCHISTKEGVELVRQAKKEGLKVSCEVTPHHLLLNENDVGTDDGNYKMNPPLRSKEDQLALIEGLKDKTIEMIATDHAPHSVEEKSKGLAHSAMGIVGLETSFGLLYKFLVKKEGLKLTQLVDCMSANVADIFGVEGGFIEQAEKANLTLINLNDQEKITAASLVSKGKNTPFINQYMQGIVYMTICDGKVVYRKKVQ